MSKRISNDKRSSPAWLKETKESSIEVLKNNGTLFTVFAVTLILISGVAVVENASNWWISVVSIVVFFATIFLFINARVILKSIIATILTLVLSGLAFNTGSNLEVVGPGGIVWMLGTLFLYFTTLSISYLIPSGKSRWGSITLSQLVFFALTFSIAYGFEHVQIATAISLIVSLALFIYSYRFTKASRESKKHFPANIINPEFIEKIQEAAEKTGFEVIDRSDEETHEGSLIIWGESKSKNSKVKGSKPPQKNAYMLYPVRMNSSFTPIGRKLKKLGYRDRNINPWLINIAFKEVPTWQSRGAEIIPVLIDLRNGNGHTAHTIGVQLPDTKKVMPFGIFPGKVFESDNIEKISKALLNIDEEYSEFTNGLTVKQEKALNRMTMTEEIKEDKED